ncbi:MAG: glycosyltransferase family 2 protein [Cyanobacteria bacterium J06559_3]
MTNGSHTEAMELVSVEADPFDSYDRRRLKAAVALAMVWSCTMMLHLLAWGQWVVYGLTLLTGAHLFRILRAQPKVLPDPLPSWHDSLVIDNTVSATSNWPYVSILVAAKNEAAVIGQLAQSLMAMDYPPQRYDVWLIDDNSTDGTSELMDSLAQQYVNLHVIHRDHTATGGKSGALNQVWRKTKGSVLVVFDADAQITPDCLRQVVPLFDTANVGAVQMRKAIANSDRNFWTRGQVAEMAFDAYCQLKRVNGTGIGELRGNGQFVRRSALQQCGGWNEETITDDLDLTFRLHLTGWDIPLVMFPAVLEEGVDRAVALWHQRNRWAEGGYQRYLDYWRFLTPSRLGWAKTWDLFVFFLIQYALQTAALPDLALAIARNRMPVFLPLSSLMLMFSSLGMANGLWRTQKASSFSVFIQTLRGMVYMMHWFVVISTVTFRMAIRPKRLKWVKTQHSGLEQESLLEPSR